MADPRPGCFGDPPGRFAAAAQRSAGENGPRLVAAPPDHRVVALGGAGIGNGSIHPRDPGGKPDEPPAEPQTQTTKIAASTERASRQMRRNYYRTLFQLH